MRLFQLNCLFAEINVHGLLIKENFKNLKDVFEGHISLHSRERSRRNKRHRRKT